MPGGVVMALPMPLVAGMLIFSGVKASDIADASRNDGFLSKYMPLRSEASKSSIGDIGKFMAHHLNHIERGGWSEVSMGNNDPQAGTFRTSRTFEPQKIADKDEDEDVQKLFFVDASNKHIGLSAIGVALLSVAAMLGVHMRRGMQSAVALASSGVHGIDMSRPLAPVPADYTLELISQDPRVRSPEQVLQGSTRGFAQSMHADIKSPFALWDPLGLGEAEPEAYAENFRESELQHGRGAMFAVFLISPEKKQRSMVTLMLAATATAPRPAKLDTLVKAVAGLPDDKYRYKQLLHWAQEAPSLPAAEKIDSNKVPGCLSTVHVVVTLDDDSRVVLQGDSDAQLTKGLVVFLVKGLSGATPEEVLSLDASFIQEAGVAASLTPGRNNGFVNMLALVKSKVAALSGGSVACNMDVDALREKLAALQPTCVEATGVSSLKVVAACFEGLAPEKRQALVGAVLGGDGDGVEVVCETPCEGSIDV